MELVDEAPRVTTAGRPRALFDPPGGVLMWIVVILELSVFTIIFGVIAYLRSSDEVAFALGQRSLSPAHGLVLTLLLMTSGWLTAEAVHRVRGGEIAQARRYYAAAGAMGASSSSMSVATGAIFVVVKVVDYVHKTQSGLTLGASDFWDVYFLSTGFHLLHVLVGLVLLAYVGARAGRTTFEDEETTVAGTALFFHMCDLAWFFLFPLLYVRS